ncbi:MAG: hypothetical protein U0441_21960 [Polyangiaceae bacterium]
MESSRGPDRAELALRAVEVLNYRLASAQKTLVRATTVAAVAAGFGAAAWTVTRLDGDVSSVRMLVPAFLLVAIGTFGVGAAVTRAVLGVLKVRLARELADREGANVEDVLEFALPFGGPPGRESSQKAVRQGVLAAAGTLLATALIGIFLDWVTAARVLATVTACLATAGFWGYLGMRPPR